MTSPTPGLGAPVGLTYPKHLSDTARDAVQLHHERLVVALTRVGSPDWGGAVGAAKDLVECIARVTCEEVGEPSPGDDFAAHVRAAHKALGRQPGGDLSSHPGLLDMANGLRLVANALAPLRNGYGSGHGRPQIADVALEVAEVAIDGALLWSRWALRRLGHLQHGNTTTLVRDLTGVPSASFRSGELAERLLAARLQELPDVEQRRLGVAVGRRTAAETFNVAIDGVDPMLTEPERWPVPYRLGVLAGLLADADGTLRLTLPVAHYVPQLATLLAANAVEEALAATERQRLSPYGPRDALARQAVREAMRAESRLLPAAAAGHWERLRSLLEEPTTA